MSPNLPLAKQLTRLNWIFSSLVLLLVGAMRQIKIPTSIDFSIIPAINAILNSLVFLLLIAALIAIKKKNIPLHKCLINLAMGTSILFLLCYVSYHFTTPETRYGGTGSLRIFYYIVLISHICLAAISLPLILQTWILGFTQHVQKHKKWTRFVFPLWLYVSFTGPLCYLLLRPYYS